MIHEPLTPEGSRMRPMGYDKNELKLLLQTSQGFPAQSPDSKAHVRSPRRLLSGAAEPLPVALTSFKTRFSSLDAAADALSMVFRSAEGVRALQTLTPGARDTLTVDVTPALEIEADVAWSPAQRVKFTRTDMALAGMTTTRCVAVLEGRPRAGRTHVHVHTFYPKLEPTELEALLDKKTAP
jgi:hypothetical protein